MSANLEGEGVPGFRLKSWKYFFYTFPKKIGDNDKNLTVLQFN